jgi:hypothetical protein
VVAPPCLSSHAASLGEPWLSLLSVGGLGVLGVEVDVDVDVVLEPSLSADGPCRFAFAQEDHVGRDMFPLVRMFGCS